MLCTRKNLSFIFVSLLLAVSVVFLSFLWQGSIDFSLWDEGFLWYGVQGVLRGEVPIRDFMAYDPGRYYWSAFISSLIGDGGIISLRVSVAIFQALGLFCGLLVIIKSKKQHNPYDFVFLVLYSFILIVWMYPRHKLFDLSISIFLIGLLSFLIQKPTLIRHFVVGIGIGMAAIFGRNHGLYGFVSAFGVILWLQVGHFSFNYLLKSLSWWILGVFLGFSPIIILIIYYPGFAASYWESILFIFEYGETNLPLPIPWPWSVDYSSLPILSRGHHFLVGSYFFSLLLFGFSSLFFVVFCKFRGQNLNPVFVAVAFLSLPYAHYAFSRADVAHLAHGIFPLLIGTIICLNYLPALPRFISSVLVLSSGVLVMFKYQPGFLFLRQANGAYADVQISNSILKVPIHVANSIDFLRKTDDLLSNNSETMFVTPFWPGAYPLLEKKSPLWEIYALLPRSPKFEKREIMRLKKALPPYAIVMNQSIDNRENLRFKNTHPITYAYIMSNFQKVNSRSSPGISVYKYKHIK